MLYRDTADGNPYVYSYIRQISKCTYPSHKAILLDVRKSGEFLPCEINLARRAYFYKFNKDQWKNKDIKFIGSFD